DCLQDLGREGMKGKIAEPVLEEYITVTRRNYISENDEGKFGTNGEDAVEHNEKFLNSVEPINIQNVSSNRLRLSIFPVSLTGAASKWFREECIGSVTTWEDLTEL
ncbi:hypothetical protein Tco_1002087, partial [Tanacetum coccineum]